MTSTDKIIFIFLIIDIPLILFHFNGAPIDPSTRRRQGFGGQAAFTAEPDEVSGRTD